MKAGDNETDQIVTGADRKKEGWQSSNTGDMTTEERSLDVGESGQFAPGGYYNQQGVNEPRRNLDDEILPPGRHSRRRE